MILKKLSFEAMIAILFLLMLPTLIIGMFIVTGEVAINCQGFAVDSYENVYIGKIERIEVYNSNNLLKEVYPKTSRGYSFTIYNDNILLSTGMKSYVMDLDGNIINENENDNFDLSTELKRFSNVCITKDGTKYILKNTFGRYKVVCDDKIIYKMPMSDYIMALLFYILIVLLSIFVPILVIRGKEEFGI